MSAERMSDPLVSAAQMSAGHPFFRLPTHLPGALPAGGAPVLAALPVVFWLMDLLRPKRVVNQAGARGLAHLACCEMAARAGGTCALISDSKIPETLLIARNAQFRDHSVDLSRPEALAAGSVDLVTIPLPRAADVGAVDWSLWRARRAPAGVILAYGAGCHDLGALGGLTGDAVLMLGPQEAPVLLALGQQAPAVLHQLADQPSDAPERQALDALVVVQMRRLELEVLARAQPILGPDPTTLDLPPPQSLAEAEAQMARLIEQQAADLDGLQAEFDARDAEMVAQDARHQAERAAHRQELARKDAIIARLEAHIAAEPPAAAAVSRRRFWRWRW